MSSDLAPELEAIEGGSLVPSRLPARFNPFARSVTPDGPAIALGPRFGQFGSNWGRIGARRDQAEDKVGV